MKAKLEFDLNDRDDQMAHLRCVKSLDMAIALWKIQQIAMGIEKYEYTPEQIQEKIFEELGDINLDELIE
jgi:hypothetical protein